MSDSSANRDGLVWKDEYSVNVKEIDNQHKELIEIINHLIEMINATPNEETVKEIINKIVQYKSTHFATEEKYFHQFNFEGTAEHEAKHREFNQKVEEIKEQYKEDVISFAFALVDFLEDWLINHLITMDHKYIKCFNDHGLV